MKIHGTAKGGAIGEKDFGVAFGGGVPEPSESCPVEDETSSDTRITSNTYGQGLSVVEGAEIVGKTITKISFVLKKVGSPTGTIYVRAWDSSGDIPSTVAANFGTKDVSTISTSYTKYTFEMASGEYEVISGSQIGMEWVSPPHSDDVYMQGQNSASTEGLWFLIHTGGTPYELLNTRCPNYCYFGS